MQQHSVRLVAIEQEREGQRIDNFLIAQLKGVPKSFIYRIIRKHEVRVNKKRVTADYKLKRGDSVRIPPVRVSEIQHAVISPHLSSVRKLIDGILFEDDDVLVINKPAQMAVHGGSNLSFGVIEALRSLRPHSKFLELVHRLDRDTSGVLLIAKKRSALRSLHQQLREKKVRKDYLALVQGSWHAKVKSIDAPLLKNELASGERIVRVDASGRASLTKFKVEQRYHNATLVKASPITGRTHQIRVHAQYADHAIAGDDKYGDRAFAKQMKDYGLHRLFLHAHSISFTHPQTLAKMTMVAPLDDELKQVLKRLATETTNPLSGQGYEN